MLASLSTHPANPAFTADMRARCPGIPNDALLRFEDAATCLSQRILRAAVVMIGLAYEEICKDVVGELVTRGRIGSAGHNQRGRAQALQQFVSGLSPRGPRSEGRHRGLMALGTAESVRVKRNQASHPGERFDSHEDTDQLLVLAGRSLPDLWNIRTL